MTMPRLATFALIFAIAFTPILSRAQTLTPSWQLNEMSRCIGCGGLSTVDLDADGVDEIIATAGESDSRFVAIFKHHDGEYLPMWRSPWYATSSVRAARIWPTANAHELFVMLADGTVEVYETKSFELVRSAKLPLNALTAMAVGDIDGSGNASIVVVSNTHLGIYDGVTFDSLYQSTTYYGTDVEIGDVTGDGQSNIVIGSRRQWDGAPDGVVLDGATRDLTWRYVTGFGTDIELSDVSGDGTLDIVAMLDESYRTYVRAFNSKLRTPLWEIQTDGEYRSMAVAPITDGELAVVLGSRYHNLTAYRASDQQQMWTFSPSPNRGAAIGALAVGDVSGDESPKIIIGGGDYYSAAALEVIDPVDRLTIWQSPNLGGRFGVAHADVTGDGHNEIIIVGKTLWYTSTARQVMVLDRHFNRVATASLPGSYSDHRYMIAAADVTHDGKSELFISDGGKSIWMLGGPRFELIASGDVSAFIRHLAVADIDGDGELEVVAGDDRGYLTILDAQTLTTKWSTINTGAPITGFALAECRLDGTLDIILYAEQGIVQAYSADQRLLWQAGEARNVSAMAAGDLYRTGSVDLVAGDTEGNIRILDCDDGTEKESHQVLSEPIHALWMGDLDEGRERELAVGSSRLSIVRSTDFETMWESQQFKGGVGARGNLYVLDIDGDRFLDFLVGTDDAVVVYGSDIDFLDMHPPFALRRSPSPEFANASVEVPIEITFSKSIVRETLDQNSLIVRHDDMQVDYSIEYDEASHKATVTPDPQWPSNATISVTLVATIADSSGNSFDGNRNGVGEGSPDDDLSWMFSTGSGVDESGPTIISFTASADTLWRGIRVNIAATAADTSAVATSTVARIVAYLDDIESAEPFDLSPSDRTFDTPVESGELSTRTDDWPFGTRTLWLRAQDSGGNWGAPTAVDFHVVVEREDNWATGGRNNLRTGYNPLDSLQVPFRLAWSKSLNESLAFSEVAIADGVVYATGVDEGANSWEHIATAGAFDIRDGRSLWRWSGPEASSINPPAVAYGMVFLQSNDHTPGSFVYALDARTGDLVWQEPYESQWSQYGAPAISDGTVVVGGGYYDGMYGFDAFTGAQQWFQHLPQVQDWAPAVVEGIAITPVLHGEMKGVRITDGSLAWHLTDMNSTWESPAIAVDINERLIYTGDGPVMALDMDDRSTRWSRDGFGLRALAVAEDVLYVLRYGSLEALDKRTGEKLWTQSHQGLTYAGPVVSRDYVFFSSSYGTYALDRATGERVAEFGGAYGISLGNQHLLLVGQDFVLRAFVAGDPVSLDPPSELPLRLALEGNFPNPFSDRTHIRFSVPTATHATLTVYNVLGQEVATLVDDHIQAGSHEEEWQASGLSSGVYFATLTTSGGTRSIRLVLAR